MAEIRVEVRENELLRQIEELQIDVHRLNNQINLIPHPILEYPMVGGPQVIFADDDGMEIDANVIAVPEAVEEEEELEHVEDEDGEGVVDADTNEDAQFSYSTKLDALVRYLLLSSRRTCNLNSVSDFDVISETCMFAPCGCEH